MAPTLQRGGGQVGERAGGIGGLGHAKPVGFTLQQVAYQHFVNGDFERVANEFLDGLGNDMPYMAEHVRAHLGEHDDHDEFGFVLDLILDGLERSAAQR